jgi:ketose-bisphosphate aldolase
MVVFAGGQAILKGNCPGNPSNPGKTLIMALVSSKEILRRAQAGHYAVGMFDVANYEMIRGVVEAAEAQRSPLLLGALKPDLEGRGLDYYMAMARVAAETASVPVAIHLDHAGSFAECRRAIEAGFNSVMIDASMQPFDENVRIVREVCEYAHRHGVTVEAELGHVPDAIAGYGEAARQGHIHKDPKDCLTQPGEVARFVELTGVDALAVAIGTAHGAYISTPVLEIGLLQRIRAASEVLLVLHGGSGTPEDQLRPAIANGITKINVYTDLLIAMFTRLRDELAASRNLGTWPCQVYAGPVAAMQAAVTEKIRIFGSAGKA